MCRGLLPLPWKAWDCEEIIVSDVGRSADFTNPKGKFVAVRGLRVLGACSL